MAFRHGRFAQISVASNDLSSYCDTADLSIDIDTAETSAFGNTWKTHIAGLIGGTYNLSGSYDPTASTGPAAVLWSCITGGVPVTLVAKPGGTASGQRTNTFDALITSYSESDSIGDRVTFSADFIVTGAVTPAQQ